MRHLVRLTIPDQDFDMNINGMMRLDPAHHQARVVGMGGFGLKLFDLTVLPGTMTVRFLHPSLQRINDVEEHIAFCIRRIWLGYGPSVHDTVKADNDSTTLCGNHNGVRLVHTFSRNALTTTTAKGNGEAWHIVFEDREPQTNLPLTLTFQNDSPTYSLFIRRVDASPGE
jgi:hypothetical protein